MENKKSNILEFKDGDVLNAGQLNTMLSDIGNNTSGISELNEKVDILKENISSINTDIQEIEAIGDLLSFKGDISLKSYDDNTGHHMGLVDLESCSVYSIYRIVDSESNIKDFNFLYNYHIKNYDYMICEKSFSTPINNPHNIKDFQNTWSAKPTLSNYADKDSPGLVSTLNQEFAGNKTFKNNVNIEGDLHIQSNKIYHNRDEISLLKKGQLEALNENLNLRIENIEVDQELLAEQVAEDSSLTNDILAKVVKQRADIDKNSGDIATNKNNISKNKALIDKNASSIESNASSIQINSDNIEINKKDIETNANLIKTNEENISSIFNTYSQIVTLYSNEFNERLEKYWSEKENPNLNLPGESLSPNKFYFVKASEELRNENGDILIHIGDPLRLYIGDFLLAMKGTGSSGGTSNGFPYTFPIIF